MRQRLQAGAERVGHGIAGAQNLSRASSVEIAQFKGFSLSGSLNEEAVALTAKLMTWDVPIRNVGLRAEIGGLSRCGETPRPHC